MSQLTCQRTIAGLTFLLLMATLAPGQRAPGIIDVAELSEVALFAFGQSPGDQLRVLGTGDFNGDGLSDVLVGSQLADGPDNQRVNAGSAYIIFGNPRGLGVRDLGSREDLREDVTLFGAEGEDRFGLSATIGDINGDMVDDIIISAIQADGPGNSRENAGEVYIFFGGSDLMTGTIRDVAGQLGREPDITIFGEERNDTLGASLALGDVNGDGLDLIIGAPGTFGPGNIRAAAGSVYIIFGGPRLSTPGVIDLADPPPGAVVVIHGADTLDNAGFAVKAGDLDNDGIDDIVFSAPLGDGPANLRRDAGEVYVLFGRRDLARPSVRDVAGIFGPGVDLTIFGQDPADGLGASLAIGDVNGDGVKDLVVGATGADGPENNRFNAGEVYVILGSPRLRFQNMRDIAAQVGRAADLTLFGAASGDQFGFSLNLGELSGNGIADLIIGAPGVDGPNNQRANAGAVYVIFGGPNLINGLRRDMAEQVGPPADLTLLGPDPGVSFGVTTAVADLDGDRVNDLIVSAPFVGGPNNTRPGSGGAFVISGR